MSNARILVTAIVNVPLQRICSAEALSTELAWVARRVLSVVRLKVTFSIVCARESFRAFVAWESLYTPWDGWWDGDCGLPTSVRGWLTVLAVIWGGIGLLGVGGTVVVRSRRVYRLLRLACVLGVVLI